MQRSVLRLSVLFLLAILLAPGHLYAVASGAGQPPLNAANGAVKAPRATPRSLKADFKDGELLVKFKAGASESRRDALHRKHGARKRKEFPSLRLQHVRLPEGMSVEEGIELYRADPDVEYAEPNTIYHLQATPNDPSFGQLWGMLKIAAPAAWDITTGSSSVVVAVIDSGVDYTHPDLAANIWSNPGEIAGNGVDDDNNGYKDDIHGIDAHADTSDPYDQLGHGTHVAGIIGAVGNNLTGGVGVNWNVKILACKAGDASDNIYTDAAIECLQYVKALKDKGVNIVATNNSWGGPGYNQALYDAIRAQGDILFMGAAGNDYASNDSSPDYPASYPLPNIVSVAATDSSDAKASFSNWGRRTVHVGAPGVSILSTLRGNSYASWDGTSMATPHVAGLAALLKAQNPGRSGYAIRNLILSGGDVTPAMNGATLTGRRINAQGSLSCSNAKTFSVLKYPGAVTVGTPVTLSAISVGCELPLGPVTVTTSAGEVITLHDDGVAPDLTAGDGVFSGTWTPARVSEILTFASSAGGETVVIAPLSVAASYVHEANTRVPYSYTLPAKGGLPPYRWSIGSGTLPPGLALDPSGLISGTPTATGSSSFSATVTDAFNLTSTKALTLNVVSDPVLEVWSTPYDYGYSENSAAIATDRSGNIFTTGFTTSGIGAAVFLTTKQDPSGGFGWAKTFWSALTPGYAYWPHGLAADGAGNLFVAGERFSISGYICRYLKYSPSGSQLWYMSLAASRCTSVAVAPDGSILVAGGQSGTSADSALLVKADTNGTILWTRYHLSGASEIFNGVALDPSGNSYATGSVYDGSSDNLVLAKFNPAGNLLWSTSYGSSLKDEYGSAVATDGSGHVYVAGIDSDDGQSLVLKYDAAGALLWTRSYPAGALDKAGIAVDAAGNVYLAAGAVVLKYDPAGDLVWTKGVGSGTSSGIALDPSGGIVVSSGTSNGVDGDYLTLKYREYLDISTTSLPEASAGAPYRATLVAFGGATPYSWSLSSGALPAGLSLNPASGALSGTPAAAGSYAFTLQLTDSALSTVSRAFTLTVNPAPSVATAALPAAFTGVPYSQTLTGAGGTPPYSWSLASGALPAGLALDGPTGVVSGIPATAGSGNFTVQLSDVNTATAARPLTLAVNYLAPSITTTSLPPANTGLPYSQRLLASGGARPLTWSIASGALPAGLSLNPASGVVSGTPTALGTVSFSARVSDAQGGYATRSLSVKVDCPKYVFTWGYNYYGQLGDGTLTDRSLPVAVPALGGVTAVSSGEQHTLALKADGTVWGWGYNPNGELGNGTGMNSSVPVQAVGLSGVAAVEGAYFHSVAVKVDGTLWAWGHNGYGQLGDGTTTTRYAPVQVPGSSNFSAVGAGTFYSVALKGDGTVWAWGNNAGGQLGDGTTVDRHTPVQVSGLSGVVAVAVGYYHALALKGDGTVWGWGSNNSGQLGDGTTVERHVPVQVAGLSDVTQIAAGDDHSLALKADGTVRAWGANGYGQLGDGTTTARSAPVQVSGLSGVGSLSGGGNHSLALKPDGTVWSWGYNNYGQLGDGTALQRTTPVQVSLLVGASALASGASHSIALAGLAIGTTTLPGATVGAPYAATLAGLAGVAPFSWSIASGTLPAGLSLSGTSGVISGTPTLAGSYLFTAQLSDATGATATREVSLPVNPAPVIVSAALPAAETGVPYSQTLAASGGTLPYSWSIASGALPAGLALDGSTGVISGTPTASGGSVFTLKLSDANLSLATRAFTLTVNYLPPTLTTAALPPASIGFLYSQALVAAGGARPLSWSIAGGALPAGLTLNAASGLISGTPGTGGSFSFTAQVTDSHATSVQRALGITVAQPHYVFATGSNRYGQLGDGTSTSRILPAPVPSFDGAFALAAGDLHSAALRSDGTLWSWGYNYYGQLGDGTTTNRYQPVQVLGGVSAVAAARYQTVALKGDGTVWSWGYNSTGQLGDGTTTARSAPAQVPGLSGVAAVAAGYGHTVALKADGTVWAWGDNSYGQLGDGTQVAQYAPQQVPGLSGVVAVAAGWNHTLALLADGTVRAWGQNSSGQLGDTTGSNRSAPVPVPGLSSVRAIAAGFSNSLALKLDGTLQSWGANGSGQLGDGTSNPRYAPGAVLNLTGVTALAVGSNYCLAVKGDGNLWGWGYNYSGQLGDGSTATRYQPAQAQGIQGVSAVAAGINHALALAGVSIGTFALPAATSGAGYTASLAGQGGVTPYAWSLVSGSLPDGLSLSSGGVISGSAGNTGNYLFTVRLSDARAATSTQTLALLVNAAPGVSTAALPAAETGILYTQALSGTGGTLPYSWSLASGALPAGLALNGSTGVISGTPTVSGSFLITVGLADANLATASKALTLTVNYLPPTIATTALPPAALGLPYLQRLSATGGAWPLSWSLTGGALPPGLTLDGASGVVSGTPSAAGTAGFTAGVSDSRGGVSQRTLAIKVGQPENVFSWGSDNNGQLGDGAGASQSSPVQVPAFSAPFALAGGYLHSVALKADGTVWSWGYNGYAQLGDGSYTTRYAPVAASGLSGVAGIAAGYYHSVAVKGDGTLWSWGSNSYGQLGDGTTSTRTAPVQVPGLSGFSAVAAGYGHTVALKGDGTVWTWGNNAYGQLGDGGSTTRYLPAQVPGLSGVVAVAAGYYHSVALKSDGTVWSWGQGSNGQMGDGNTSTRYLPEQASGLSAVTGIAAGYYHTVALKGDGSVWSWGLNSYGQLGNGNYSTKNSPAQVPGLSGVTAVCAGFYHTVALSSDGSVRSWGYNSWGQLGDGTLVNRNTPVPVPGLSGVAAIAAGGLHSLALSALQITTGVLPAGITGIPYSQTLGASGGLAPYSWSVAAGTLPGGLALVGATGELSGTPTSAGTFSFTLQVSGANGATAGKAFTLAVVAPMSFTPWALPQGVTGTPYSQRLQVTGGTAPYSWTLQSGTLPWGLTLDATGLISGVPVASGVYSFAPRVSDAADDYAARSLAITVSDLACANPPARIFGATPLYLPDFLAAYGAAGEGDLIQLQALSFSADLVLERGIGIALSGGYDCGYSAHPASSSMTGALRVRGGKVKLDGIRFR